MRPDVCDISHLDSDVDFGQLKAAGVIGVTLKASQGSHFTDPSYAANYKRAIEVFGAQFVHSYHFLDGSNYINQIALYPEITQGHGFRWLDYERNESQCDLAQAVGACHLLSVKQGKSPGFYGADKDLLGSALDMGHFTICPLWIASYDSAPSHKAWKLWQWQAQENPRMKIEGKGFDLSEFNGTVQECRNWFGALTNV